MPLTVGQTSAVFTLSWQVQASLLQSLGADSLSSKLPVIRIAHKLQRGVNIWGFLNIHLGNNANHGCLQFSFLIDSYSLVFIFLQRNKKARLNPCAPKAFQLVPICPFNENHQGKWFFSPSNDVTLLNNVKIWICDQFHMCLSVVGFIPSLVSHQTYHLRSVPTPNAFLFGISIAR